MSLPKGLERERYYSKKVHSNDIALLISPLVLRDRGCGQVDLASIKSRNHLKKVYLFEVKTHLHISHRQLLRLRKSANFVSLIFSSQTYLKIIS